MIKSMTGYGRAETTFGNQKITIELRSLNSKGMDLAVRIPSVLREKEMEIRNRLSQEVVRGKCDFSVYIEKLGGATTSVIDKDAIKNYYAELRAIETELGISSQDILPTLLKMPDVMQSSREELTEELWQKIDELITECIHAFQTFRLQEGNSLETDLLSRINSIAELLTKVDQYEGERIETVKTRLKKNLDEMVEKGSFDANRFEQELIYYLEKYDVSEEKVRLANHLDYFKETLSQEVEQGKKLGFIGQEIGREINTLGSKANHTEIQKLVVLMKDELERIKEQVLNVL
jgi:uncharacterized protein (TIGR00255 family)